MDGDIRYSIGDLARRTGLTIKTIRFYADRGIVPPTDRNAAGHRCYDIEAVARLELVRTLRDLGLDLAMIRKVLDREASLPDVAAAHAEALAAQIRVLRMRRAVLTVVAKRGSNPQEVELMHRLVKLSEDERHRLIDDFLGTAFAGFDGDPAFTGIMRSMTPELPDDPEPGQIEAWLELAELSRDPGFRSVLRGLAEHHAVERARGDNAVPRRPIVIVIRDCVEQAMGAGVGPGTVAADAVVASVRARYADIIGPVDDIDRRLLTHLEQARDPRRERYFRLLSTINGWAAPDSLAPVLEWFIEAYAGYLTRSGHALAGGR